MKNAKWMTVAALTLMTACGPRIHPAGYEIVYVDAPPPTERVEVITTRPGVEFAWVQGYWRWEHRAYAWSPGHWERAPRRGSTWVRGRWQHGRRGWYFTPGHWR